MERELEARRKTIVRRHAFDSLVDAHAIEVPKALVEDEITMLQRNTMQQMRIADEAKAPPREEFRESARRRIAMALLVQELIRTRELRVDQARLSQRIEALAAGYEDPRQAAQQYRASREFMAQIESTVLEEQVVELMTEEAKTRPKPVKFAEFMN
jgi:trigger factor